MAATRLYSPLFALLIIACLSLIGCSGGGDDNTPDPNAVRPTITGLSTNAAAAGTQLIVNGINFGNNQAGSSVSINDVDFTVVEWTDTRITVMVTGGMTSGLVVVTVNGLDSQNGPEAQLFIPNGPAGTPLISAVSPDYGYAGESQVLITGTGFGSDSTGNGVFFSAAGGTTVQADIVSIDVGGTPTPQWTNSSIKVIVPNGAITGPLHVMSGGLQSNSRTFTILPPLTPPGSPVITDMAPMNGPVGTTVTFTGDNFGHTQGGSTIKIGGISLEVLSWNNEQIIADIPVGAQSGSIRITVAGKFVESASFTVANAPVITGVSPQVLKIGAKFTLFGDNFGFSQGTGKLQIGSSTVVPSSWDNETVIVDELPPFNFADADAIPVTLTNDAGLSDSSTVKLGTNLNVTVQVTPAAGEAGTTQFNFFVAVNGGSGNYTYSLMPDANKPTVFGSPSNSNPVTYTYATSDVPVETTFQTRMKIVDNSNQDTAIVDGPEVFVVPQGTPVITSIELADFNNPFAESPRNEWTFVWEPPLLTKELYHDFTFIAGDPFYASGLSEFDDGISPIASTTRVLRNFKSGQSLPRPYGYRYAGGGERGSVVRINGINLGDVQGTIYLNSNGPGSSKVGIMVDGGNVDAWSDTQVDFYLPADTSANLTGKVWMVLDGGDEVQSSQDLLCSPYITNVLPNPVSFLGTLTLTGFDLTVPKVDGVTDDNYFLFFVPRATYDDPFGAGTQTNQVLLTTPFEVTPGANTIQFNMSSLGAGGPVEVFNITGDQYQVVDGTFVDGAWSVFIWSGAITEGTSFVKANSGIFSESYEFNVSVGPPGP